MVADSASKIQPKKKGGVANLTNAGKGRPKGSLNKTTVLAKDAIHGAFEKMGGVDAMVKWADANDDNRKVFYSQIWTKIIPLQIGGDPDGDPVRTVTQIQLVGVRPDGVGPA